MAGRGQSKRANSVYFALRARLQHLQNGLAAHRVAPIGGDVSQRHQNKGAVLQAGMGKNQLIGGDFALLVGGKIGPMLPNLCIGQDAVAHRQKVKIQRPPCPAGGSGSPELRFDLVQ